MKGRHHFKKIVILTGAGISAESGLSTFRDSHGLWEKHRIEEVATPEAFFHNPGLVWKFYSMRRLQAAQAQPNKAHFALVDFTKFSKAEVHLVTQNVDGLHQRADPEEVLPALCMHGSLNQSSCHGCGNIFFDDFAYFDLKGNYAPKKTAICNPTQRSSADYLHHYKLTFKNFLPLSPCCHVFLRPKIVWFGETPLHMVKIENLLLETDLFVSIGTSGQVYPAAGFLQKAKISGAMTVCINKERLPQNEFVDQFIEGAATVRVPEFFANL